MSKQLEDRLSEWLQQPGTFITEGERGFIRAMREYASQGVGYGWMQQVIEWEWQAQCAAAGLPGGAWGPEYFEKRIAELEGREAEDPALRQGKER